MFRTIEIMVKVVYWRSYQCPKRQVIIT